MLSLARLTRDRCGDVREPVQEPAPDRVVFSISVDDNEGDKHLISIQHLCGPDKLIYRMRIRFAEDAWVEFRQADLANLRRAVDAACASSPCVPLRER